MTNIIYDLIFLLISIFILLKAIGYAIYEIKELNNKVGGITIISFSILVIIFANIMMWIRQYYESNKDRICIDNKHKKILYYKELLRFIVKALFQVNIFIHP